MKVTVSFGVVRVVVPCGNGDITVTELMEKSVQRYRKATGRNDDYWVRIKSLKSEGEDGILDVDDLVCDVADDREKLIAVFDEQDRPRPSGHLITDGTSTCTSSVGTASPLLNFNSLDTNGQMNNSNNKMLSSHYGDFDDPSEVDVVVTGDEISSDPKLHVRRGSDPIIPIMNGDPQKWSGDPQLDMDSNANTLPDKKPSQEIIEKRRGSKDELNSAFSRFGRDSSRQSISGILHNNMYKWAEAQQKTDNKTNGRQESEGDDDMEREQIVIKNDGTPLGIQIIARVENDDDSAYGLVIHGIETGGRAARDGRLKQGDHILTINKLDITEMTFDGAQELLRDAMRTESVTLTVEREKQPLDDQLLTNQNQPAESPRVPPDVPARAPATSLSKEESQSQKVHNIIAPTNTRRIGRKLYVQLMKGPQGLGFSITTRDNAVGGKNPIYIKNILPKGAAIADGRCKPGDRLLEVNGIEMTGKTQSEAVSILRSVRLGGVVNLVLSRQESGAAATPEKVLPRELPEEKTSDDPTNAKNKAVVVFDIPLNDTGSAGLGVSVKGKTSGNGTDGESKDLGIFIKSVIHGGAASKDGRLRPNDQLLYINEESLISISNSSAMDILRRSMAGDKSPRSHIRLVIARRTDPGDVTPTSSRPSDRGIETKPESLDGDGRPGSPVSISSRGMEIDMEAMDELFKHPVLNKLNAIEKEQLSRDVGPGGDGYAEDTSQLSPTMPKGGEEIVMIDDADIDDAIAQIDATSPSASGRAPSPPQWLVDTWEKAKDEDGEVNPAEDPYNQFQRDSFARRSFSERHKGGGSLDTKQMAWYKKKGGPEPPKVPPKTGHHSKGSPQHKDIANSTGSLVRSNSTDNLKDTPNLSSIHHLTAEERRDIGPFLGLKKNSSLESLQAAVAEVTTHDDHPARPRAKVVRGRGCNESFRAAVDRSYDQPLNGNAINSVDTGSEYRENGHVQVRDDRSSRDDHSSISSHDPVMSQTGTSKKKKEKEKDKRKSGAFKGFGSMFRFGKNRKPDRESRPTEDRQRSNSVSSEKSRQDEIEKYKEQQEEQSSRIQDEVRKHRENQSLRRQKEESLEARNKAERMQELRQKYQRDHRERQGRYVDDINGDDDAGEDERGSGDREDEGYGDGSPSSPRSPRPYSPHREMTDAHAPEYRDRDHDRWERQSEGNPSSGRHHDDTQLHDERRYDTRDGGRHNGRRSVPPYIESRNRDEPRGYPERRRETHTTAEVETEPKYATVTRKPRPDRNSEPSMRDRHNDRNKPEKIYASHYESVDRRERTDRDAPKRNPDKIYESVDFQRPPRVSDRHRDERNREDPHRDERNREDPHRDERNREDPHRDERNREDPHRDERNREDPHRDERNREDPHRDERNREDRHRNDRNHEERYRDDRFYEDRHRDDKNRDDRYKEDRYREDRYRNDRYGDRSEGRRVDRRPDRENFKKHNDPDKIKNSDTLRRKGSETLSLKEGDSYNPKEKEALKRKESDTLKRKESEKTSKDKKADKSKVKETDKKEKEESKLTRRKSDKKKDEKEKEKKKEKDKMKSKDKDEKVSSEEEKPEERSVDSRRDRRDDNDRRDARRGDTLERRHRGEREGGDGRDRRREDGRRDTRDRQRSPPPSDKYGYGSLGRPHRKRTSNDPNQHNRGTRESGYQSDHDRHRPDHNHDNHSSSNHKGYSNGPTANHYPDERRPRMTSTQSIDRHHDGYYGKEDYGMSNHQSRTGRRMHYSESGLEHESHDAARV